MTAQATALISDIVGSRHLADRAKAEEQIRSAFSLVHHLYPPEQELWPTVGDEYQAVYSTLADALRATTAVRLALPAEVDLRFGAGRGEIHAVEGAEGAHGVPIQDGSAWWSARAAINETQRRQKSGSRNLRSWFVDGAPEPNDRQSERLVNAYLLMRDVTISSMKPREKRIALGTLLKRTQAELAAEEGITQGAVSQNLAHSGAAALLAATDLIGQESDA